MPAIVLSLKFPTLSSPSSSLIGLTVMCSSSLFHSIPYRLIFSFVYPSNRFTSMCTDASALRAWLRNGQNSDRIFDVGGGEVVAASGAGERGDSS